MVVYYTRKINPLESKMLENANSANQNLCEHQLHDNVEQTLIEKFAELIRPETTVKLTKTETFKIRFLCSNQNE